MGEWGWAIICYGVGMICFAGANVFYDALLVVVAPAPDRDRVSSLGYAMGYLGGGLLFVLNVLMVQQPQWFGLASSEQAVRYAFLSVALWWAGFTIFLIMWVHEEKNVLPPVRDFDFLKQGVSAIEKYGQADLQAEVGRALSFSLLVLYGWRGYHHPHGR